MSGREQEDIVPNWRESLLVWSNRFNDSNGRSREDEMKAIIDLLRVKYDDRTVFKLLKSVNEDLATNDVATKGQEQLIEKWSNVHLDPVDVLKAGERERKLEDVLTSPHFAVWAKYLVTYSKAYRRLQDKRD